MLVFPPVQNYQNQVLDDPDAGTEALLLNNKTEGTYVKIENYFPDCSSLLCVCALVRARAHVCDISNTILRLSRLFRI